MFYSSRLVGKRAPAIKKTAEASFSNTLDDILIQGQMLKPSSSNIQVMVTDCQMDAEIPAEVPGTGSSQSGSHDPALQTGDCARSITSFQSCSVLQRSNTIGSSVLSQQRQMPRRANWTSLGSSCMWDACRATTVGLLSLISGCIIVFFEFHSSMESMEFGSDNHTIHLVDPKAARNMRISFSYAGPVLVGVGIFVLISVVVATMEMRDMTTKVYPLTRVESSVNHPPKRSRSKDGSGMTSTAMTDPQTMKPAFPSVLSKTSLMSSGSGINKPTTQQLLNKAVRGFSPSNKDRSSDPGGGSNSDNRSAAVVIVIEDSVVATTSTQTSARTHTRRLAQHLRPVSPVSANTESKLLAIPGARASRTRSCRYFFPTSNPCRTESISHPASGNRNHCVRNLYHRAIRSVSCPGRLCTSLTSPS